MRDWLREIRLNKHCSEVQVAKQAGIAQSSYHRLETGEKNPSVDTAKKIANVLEFHWTKFFDCETR